MEPESTAASLVRYIEDGETVIAEEPTYKVPHQSDWTYVDGEAYKVYDVVHIISPETERMLSLAFVWSPDADATDASLDARYDRAVAARAGDYESDVSEFGDCGGYAEVIHDETLHATLTVSAFPSDAMGHSEGLVLPGVEETFVVSDVTQFAGDEGMETGIYLFEVSDPETGARGASVRRTLNGQRSKAQEREMNE